MPLKRMGDQVDVSLAGESPAYRKACNKLLKAEIELKDQRERVARMRRELPLGPKVETDYVFLEGPRDLAQEEPISEVRLSQLFEKGKDELILINTMFGPEAPEPCSMCNMWADGYNAVASHIEQQKNFALVTRKDIRALRAWARRRGWRNIRLLSASESTFNRDFNVEWAEKVFEGPNGQQVPGVTVFKRLPNGDIHHTYSVEAAMSPKEHRAIDLFTPVWNLFDLTPSGRAATWYPKTAY
ncbi:MAG TPA: DUF899 family protein [Thermoanaerobaculia bacterium]|nr:DUF899 family protein [Thermoanaerobaculia bacterium]